MYVALIAALTKNPKIKKATYTFLATYGLIAGIAVMLYPSTVFIGTIGINIQTMIHHGSMVFIGFLLLINNKTKYSLKDFFPGMMVFIACVLVALTIDVSTYYLGIDGGLKMFFISPFHESSLPVFCDIYHKTNYFIFLFIYILFFSSGSFAVLKITEIIKKHDKIVIGD